MSTEKKVLTTTNLFLLTLILVINVVTLIFVFDKNSKKRVKTIGGQIRHWFKDKSAKLKKKFKKK